MKNFVIILGAMIVVFVLDELTQRYLGWAPNRLIIGLLLAAYVRDALTSSKSAH